MLKASLKGSCLHPLAGKHTLFCFLWTVVLLDNVYLVHQHLPQSTCARGHAELTELKRGMSLVMAHLACC